MRLSLAIFLLVWCGAVFAELKPFSASVSGNCKGCVLISQGNTSTGKYYAPRTGPTLEAAFNNNTGTTIFKLDPEVRLPLQTETTSKTESIQFGAAPIKTSTTLLNPSYLIDQTPWEKITPQDGQAPTPSVIGAPSTTLGAP